MLRAERRGRPRSVQLAAPSLEAEQRDDRVGPGGSRRRDPRVQRVGLRELLRELVSQLLEPRAREDPFARVLDAFRLAEPADRLGPDRRVHRGRELAPLEQLEPGGIDPAGRRGIEHLGAADRRPVAEHDAVATGGDRRRGQPQLGEALAGADDARVELGRAVVDVQAAALLDRLQLVEHDVEAVADRVFARLDEGGAAAKLRPLDAGQADGHPLAGAGLVDGAVVHLDAADADVQPGRLGPEAAALADRAGPERAGRDRPDPAQGEDSVDEEPRGAGAVRRLEPFGDTGECGAQLVEALPRLRAHRDGRPRRHELARLLERQLEGLRVDRIRLRDGDDAALDAEQAQDREVLVRLRPRPFRGVDHEQEEVDPGRTGDHVSDETFVSGHVDQREPAPVRQLERGVAEVDRDPARLLLGQAVGVDPRQRPDEPGLAVVDVTRRAEDEAHLTSNTVLRAGFGSRPGHRGGGVVDLGVGERPAVEQQPAVADDADDRRLALA